MTHHSGLCLSSWVMRANLKYQWRQLRSNQTKLIWKHVAASQVQSKSIQFQSGCWSSCVFLLISAVRKYRASMNDRQRDRETFGKPEINSAADRVQGARGFIVRTALRVVTLLPSAPKWKSKKSLTSLKSCFNRRLNGFTHKTHCSLVRHGFLCRITDAFRGFYRWGEK